MVWCISNDVVRHEKLLVSRKRPSRPTFLHDITTLNQKKMTRKNDETALPFVHKQLVALIWCNSKPIFVILKEVWDRFPW